MIRYIDIMDEKKECVTQRYTPPFKISYLPIVFSKKGGCVYIHTDLYT